MNAKVLPRASFSDRYASIAAKEGEHNFLLRCARRYGDVVRLARRAYLVSRPDWINQVLMQTGNECQKFDNLIRTEADEQSQQTWLALRNTAASGTGATSVVPFIPRLVALINAAVDSWRPDTPLDAITEIRELTVRSITSFCFGDDEQEISLACSSLSRLFNTPGRANIVVRCLDWRTLWRTWAAKWRLTATVQTVIEQRQRGAGIERNDFLAVLLQARHRDPLPRAELTRTLITMLLAAHQSPAAALA